MDRAASTPPRGPAAWGATALHAAIVGLALVPSLVVGLEGTWWRALLALATYVVVVSFPVERSATGPPHWILLDAIPVALVLLTFDPAAAIVLDVVGLTLGGWLLAVLHPVQRSVPIASRAANISRRAIVAQAFWLMPWLTTTVGLSSGWAAVVVLLVVGVALDALFWASRPMQTHQRLRELGRSRAWLLDVTVGSAVVLLTTGQELRDLPAWLFVVPALVVVAVSRNSMSLRAERDRGVAFEDLVRRMGTADSDADLDDVLLSLARRWDPASDPRLERLGEVGEARSVIARLADGRALTRDLAHQPEPNLEHNLQMVVPLVDRARDDLHARTQTARVAEWRGDVLSALGHDVTQPLSTALLAASTLDALLPDEDRQARRVADALTRQINASIQIVRDLLTIARLDGRPDDTADVDVLQACHDAVATVAPRDGVAVVVHGDDLRLPVARVPIERAVANLVQNAVRHAPPSSTVEVCVHGAAPGPTIVVEDRGPGIPEEVRPTLTEPFTTGNGSGSSAGSAGLGLHLVVRFVEYVGATLEIADRPGGGARVSVHLPPPATTTDDATTAAQA